MSDICSSRTLEFQSNHMGPGCSLFFNTVWSEKTIFTPTWKSHVDSPSAASGVPTVCPGIPGCTGNRLVMWQRVMMQATQSSLGDMNVD